MNPAFQRYLDAATDLTELTAAKAEQVVRQLGRTGGAAGDQVGELAEDLRARQRRNRDAVAALVKTESTRAMRSMGLATSAEVARLHEQVDGLHQEVTQLREELARLPGGAVAASARPAAKKAAARRATTRAPAKKAATKRAPAKKAATKRAPAKKAATKRAPAKKAATKRAPAKRTSSRPQGDTDPSGS